MDSREPAAQALTGISNLPNDVLRLILQYLNDVESLRLFLASPRLFKNLSHPVRKLLGHAALGEWDMAMPMCSTLRFLLTCRSTIYHPNRVYQPGQAPVEIAPEENPGRYKYIKRTALQIAWMNEEYEIAEEMTKLMTHQEAKKQFDEIFPEGKIIKYNWDLQEAIKRLEAVFAAVIRDPQIDENDLKKMGESTKQALYALYTYVKPASEHQIGLVFDANIYLEALKCYEAKFGQFQNWHQRSFWCIRVEEHLASLLGTGYLRQHSQGILNNVDRSGCHLADKSSYFAFRRTFNSLPGLHFFVGVYGSGSQARGWTARGGTRARASAAIVSKLMSSKNESRDRTYAAIFGCQERGLPNLLK